jgi:hypothetical protein
VAGTITDRKDAEDAVEALLQAGIDADDIDVLHGEAGLQRLDPSGADHGLLARFQRAFIHVAGAKAESAALARHVDDLQSGRFVVLVRANTAERRQAVADVFKAHRATFIGFFGRWTLRALEPDATSNMTMASDDTVVDHTYEASLGGLTTRLRVKPDYTVEVTPPGLAPLRVAGTSIGPTIFMTPWQETGRNTVVQINDTGAGKAYAVMIKPDGTLHQIEGTLRRLD